MIASISSGILAARPLGKAVVGFEPRPAGLAKVVPAQIGRDRVNPGRELPLRIETAGAPDEPEKGLLKYVVGVFIVPNHP